MTAQQAAQPVVALAEPRAEAQTAKKAELAAQIHYLTTAKKFNFSF